MNKDAYFLGICNAVAKGSKCLSRQIGAVLVRDGVIVSTGYNGPPRKVPHCVPVEDAQGNFTCKRRAHYPSGEGLHLCPAAHAERNAVDQAARLGICTKGATIYMNCPIPCKECLITLIQAGIEEVVCTEMKLYDLLSGWLIKHSGIRVRIFDLEEVKEPPLAASR